MDRKYLGMTFSFGARKRRRNISLLFSNSYVSRVI